MTDRSFPENGKLLSRVESSEAISKPYRSSSQIVGQPRRPVQRQLSLDLKHDPSHSINPEPLAKRQRLDAIEHGIGELEKEEKQPKHFGQEAEFSADGLSLEERLRSSTIDTDFPASPFPPRPTSKLRGNGCSSLRKDTTSASEAVQTKPYNLGPPRSAPVYPNNVPADFFPWTGNHPEDDLSEPPIKSGYFDKAPASQSELNSARPSIWSNVKHKSGLQILSTLYISALDQREDCGTITSKSIFKPPPRATLTEAKREAWLKDLADQNVSLRRLSRTIPHGIRGRVLLDQALAKRIPIWRTIWLAKCVGANEIRAFKRKGTAGAFASGGEAKWIRDWTISNEQFLEAMINEGRTEDWREKVHYGLQLVAAIYAEHLLDKEHFLDWAVSTLHLTPAAYLPMWLLLVNMFWDEISSYRKRAQKLALALVEHAWRLQSQGLVDAIMPLWQKLSEAIYSLLLERPTSFLMPKEWAKYQPVLGQIIDGKSSIATTCFEAISQRNAYLSQAKNEMSLRRDLQQQIIESLDSFCPKSDISTVSRTCLAATGDRVFLIRTATEWASTRFRAGQWRIYLAARLIRRWSQPGIDVEAALLSSLPNCCQTRRFDRCRSFKLISELVRSHHFSIAKLLQWIMARNLPLDRKASDNEEWEFLMELLNHTPVHDLPDHTFHLRQNILGLHDKASSEITEDSSSVKDALFKELYFLSASGCNDTAESAPLTMETLDQLGTPTRLELLHWLRRSLLSYMATHGRRLSSDPSMRAKQAFQIDHDLKRLCVILNRVEDFAFLADVLSIFAEIGEVSHLTEIAEYNFNCFDTLNAIGAAQSIYETILERLQEITARSVEQMPLLMTLIELTRLLPNRKKTLSILEKELSICEPSSSIAACSPISDSMGETLQGPDTCFFEEIETIFNSGTSMDRQLISRIFADATKRLETCHPENLQSSIHLVEVLAKLYTFNQEYFEELLLTWIESVLAESEFPSFRVLLASFLCRGLIKLETVLVKITIAPEKLQSFTVISLQELLAVFSQQFRHPMSCGPHRCHVDIERTIAQKPDLVATIIRAATDTLATSRSSHRESAKETLLDATARQVLLTISRSDTALYQLYDESQRPQSLALLNEIVDTAIGIADDSASNVATRFQSTLDRIDGYNVGICGLKLKLLLGKSSILRYSAPDLESIAEIIVRQITCSTKNALGVWQRVLEGLPLIIAKKVHEIATTSLTLPIADLKLVEGRDLEDRQLALLDLVAALESCIPPEELVSSFNTIADSCVRFQDFISRMPSPTFTPESLLLSEAKMGEYRWPILHTSLSICLRLLSIYQGLLGHAKLPQPSLGRLALALSLISTNTLVQSHDSILEHTLDTLALVADALTTQTRLKCLQTIQNEHKIQDERLLFLLGPPAQEGEELLLILNDNQSPELSWGTKPPGEENPTRSVPFSIRRWELVQDATPQMGDNDASLSLALFGGRKRGFGS